MCFEVEDLSDQRLAEWLRGADSGVRADAWARLAEALGLHGASRRWLAAFAASDAAETRPALLSGTMRSLLYCAIAN